MVLLKIISPICKTKLFELTTRQSSKTKTYCLFWPFDNFLWYTFILKVHGLDTPMLPPWKASNKARVKKQMHRNWFWIFLFILLKLIDTLEALIDVVMQKVSTACHCSKKLPGKPQLACLKFPPKIKLCLLVCRSMQVLNKEQGRVIAQKNSGSKSPFFLPFFLSPWLCRYLLPPLLFYSAYSFLFICRTYIPFLSSSLSRAKRIRIRERGRGGK